MVHHVRQSAPSKQIHLYNVGTTSSTLAQHCTNVMPMFCVCCAVTVKLIIGVRGSLYQPVCTPSRRASDLVKMAIMTPVILQVMLVIVMVADTQGRLIIITK